MTRNFLFSREELECGDPEDKLLATMTTVGKHIGDNTTYECELGYEGDALVVTCQIDGNWSEGAIDCDREYTYDEKPISNY